jgi:hypothetical protein
VTAFDAQVQRLEALGYPRLLGMTGEAFRSDLRQLRDHVPEDQATPDIQGGRVPFALVINTPKLPVRVTLPLVDRAGHPAIERLYPKQPEDFQPIPAVPVPVGEAYLLLGVDRGNATLNAVPADAQRKLELQGLSPLTVEEGVSLLLQWPDFLQPNHCFMMLGSRCGDRRVPALWLSGAQPKLGWCWEGNPHTWLGFASCVSRSVGVAGDNYLERSATTIVSG